MALIPEPQHTTLRAIESAIDAEAGPEFRAHLGASVIGRPCDRELWYGFRWATARRPPARLLRLFARGQREESVLLDLLRKAGVTVWEVDERTGEQFRCSAVGGHFGGSMDGAGEGFVESEKPHVIELKTHNEKSFKALVKDGVEKAKPEHYAQMQIYMHLFGLERAFYLAVNKNDDDLYAERVRYKAREADKLLERAERVIVSDRPPPRINEDAAWYLCKFCDHHGTCHGNAVPVPTCRSCVHATPELDGQGRWSCRKHGIDLVYEQQLHGCEAHAFIPDLLARWATAEDVEADSVVYTNTLTGARFANGPAGYASRELYDAADLRMVGHPLTDELKRDFDARLAG